MTAYQGAFDGSTNGQQPGGRRCGRSRWRPAELIAMILGFIVFWPIGLAILFLKIWQRREGHQGELVDFVRERGAEMRGRCMSSANWAPAEWAQKEWRAASAGVRPTGNSAFDEWRTAELDRLEEERKKLVQAEREFSEHLDRLRRARDREEFDRFMQERRNQQSPNPGPQA